MSNFIMAVAVLSIVVVVAQFLAYFNRRERGCRAGSSVPEGTGMERFRSDDAGAEAGAPSE